MCSSVLGFFSRGVPREASCAAHPATLSCSPCAWRLLATPRFVFELCSLVLEVCSELSLSLFIYLSLSRVMCLSLACSAWARRLLWNPRPAFELCSLVLEVISELRVYAYVWVCACVSVLHPLSSARTRNVSFCLGVCDSVFEVCLELCMFVCVRVCLCAPWAWRHHAYKTHTQDTYGTILLVRFVDQLFLYIYSSGLISLD